MTKHQVPPYISSDMQHQQDEPQELVSELCDLVLKNDHQGIIEFSKKYGHITGRTSYQDKCSCGCTMNTSLVDTLDGMGSSTFEVPVTTETFQLLFDQHILSVKDIKFLTDYMSHCNCQERWKSLNSIIRMFDVEAMRLYRSEYNTTLLFSMFYMFYYNNDDEWEELFSYLVDEIGIDVNVKVRMEDDRVASKYNHTIMPLAIQYSSPRIVKKLHDMGLDVNEFRPCGEFNMSPIMMKTNSIGNWMTQGTKTYDSQNSITFKMPEKEEVEERLNKLYEMLHLLKELKYDPSILNQRMYPKDEKKPDEEFGKNLSYLIQKWKFVENDERFSIFV